MRHINFSENELNKLQLKKVEGYNTYDDFTAILDEYNIY